MMRMRGSVILFLIPLDTMDVYIYIYTSPACYERFLDMIRLKIDPSSRGCRDQSNAMVNGMFPKNAH